MTRNRHTIRRPKKFPSLPGVYIFIDERGKPLYIGKAANLKSRLLFYFRKETRREPRTEKLLAEAAGLRILTADSEIEALVREAALIKRFRPKYNILMRDDKNYLFVVVTKEKFPRIILTHQPKTFLGAQKILGPFTDAAAVKNSLRMLRAAFPYCTCIKPHAGACINSEIGKCPGICCIHPAPPLSPQDRAARETYYQGNIKTIIALLEGKKISAIEQELKKRLHAASAALAFERAARIRDQLADLAAIRRHRAIIKRPYAEGEWPWEKLSQELQTLLHRARRITRVEAYDISNIGGVAATGSMVVFVGGIPAKAEYRKFRIKTVTGANDTAMMAEVVSRRFRHREWTPPDLVVLDGGKPQLSSVLAKLRAERITATALFTALAKRDEALFVNGKNYPLRLTTMPRAVLHFFQRVRDEAHRFAKKYHHTLRRKEFAEIPYRTQS